MPISGGTDRQNQHGVYRSVTTVWSAWLMTSFMVAAIVIAVVPGKGQIVGYIFAPLCAVCTWRSWNIGVHIEIDGIRVVSPILSRRVRWEEIECFDVRPWLRNPFQGYVVLSSDSPPIPILGITGGAAGDDERRRRRAQEAIDQLNEVLAEWRNADRAKGKKPANSVQQQT